MFAVRSYGMFRIDENIKSRTPGGGGEKKISLLVLGVPVTLINSVEVY
jgi:hypothetical protein